MAYPLSENAYDRMKWSGCDEYRSAHRKSFIVNGTLHGFVQIYESDYYQSTSILWKLYILFRYIKKAKTFYDVLILNAGHMVPTDQPVAALNLMERFIKNEL